MSKPTVTKGLSHQLYDDLTKRLAQGWNPWNTRSVLSHVLLPEGSALNLSLKEPRSRQIMCLHACSIAIRRVLAS